MYGPPELEERMTTNIAHLPAFSWWPRLIHPIPVDADIAFYVHLSSPYHVPGLSWETY
jgi:hypothetical protein